MLAQAKYRPEWRDAPLHIRVYPLLPIDHVCRWYPVNRCSVARLIEVLRYSQGIILLGDDALCLIPVSIPHPFRVNESEFARRPLPLEPVKHFAIPERTPHHLQLPLVPRIIVAELIPDVSFLVLPGIVFMGRNRHAGAHDVTLTIAENALVVSVDHGKLSGNLADVLSGDRLHGLLLMQHLPALH